MAKGETGGETAAWVPTGLKVRGAAPVLDDKPAFETGPALTPALTFPSTDQAKPETGFVERRRVVPTPQPVAEPAPEPVANAKPLRPGFEPLPVLTLLSLICLGILIWLGSWQWDKFVIKSKPEISVAVSEPSSVSAALEEPNPEYQAVVVDGLSDPRTIKITAVQNGVRGYRLFSPVVLEAGGIFVDRGFVGETDVARIVAPVGQVHLNGVLRIGAKANSYTPDNDPAQDIWFWPDLTAMADTLMIQSTGAKYYVALSQVDPLATGQPKSNPYADKKGANQIPPERHLGYALTWWGFGLALLGVYIGLHVRMGRLRFAAKRP
jgi:surfeit locus 1 family protein